jgi:hypothetical protein
LECFPSFLISYHLKNRTMPKKGVIGKYVSTKFAIILLVWSLKLILHTIQDTLSLDCLEGSIHFLATPQINVFAFVSHSFSSFFFVLLHVLSRSCLRK